MLNIEKGRYLCKFTTLNKNIINSIYENNLWHARVDTLNDPFELYFNFIKVLPNSTEGLCTLMEDSNYWVEPHLIVQEREAAIGLLTSSRENELRSRVMNRIIKHEILLKKRIRTLSICSLSEAYDEPLMWSHYSDGMRGICLMFDKEKLIQSSLEFKVVTYEKTPPEFDFFDQEKKYRNNEEMDFVELFTTKHTGWGYEKEFRSISFKTNENSSKLGVSMQLKSNSLKGIIMGSNISQVDKSLLKTLSEEFGFDLYIATANNENYSVDIKGINKKPAN